MADTKATALTALTNPSGVDLLYVVDDPSGTATSKKITIETLLSAYAMSSANTKGIGITGYSLTGSDATSFVDLAGTWNTTGTPTAIKLNITDTASNAVSLLMDLQVGGASRFSVEKGGKITGDRLVLGTWVDSTSLGVQLRDSGRYSFSSTSNAGGAADVALYRDAAATLALRNSTNAQTFNIYNTYTDASNYERGFIRWSSNVFEIGTTGAGTGSTSRKTRILAGSGAAVAEFEGGYVGFYAGGTRNILLNVAASASAKINMYTAGSYSWGTADTADTSLFRVTAGITGVRGATVTDGGALSFIEQAAPSAPATNGVYIYAQDNGAGKTQLMALFPTGAAQQIAIEP